MPLGDLYRLPIQALEHWNIRVTDENRKQLEERSLKSFEEEWKVVTKEAYEAIHAAIEASGLGPGNTLLNENLAQMAAEIIVNIAKHKPEDEFIDMCDIGAGRGDTTGAILNELRFGPRISLLKRMRIYFIEPSADTAVPIRDMMKSYETLIRRNQQVRGADYDNLPMLKDNLFDIVVSNAVFHHKSFPTQFGELSRLIRPEGALVIGDWYTEVWQNPKYVAYLLKNSLSADDHMLTEFMRAFGTNWEEVSKFWNDAATDPTVNTRLEGMKNYIYNLNNELIKRQATLCLVEAHELLEQRKKKLQQHGFETDFKNLKERPAFKGMRGNYREVVPKNFAGVGAFAPKKLVA
ncbi:MAG: methyltransferase domain-containing protein [Candidatus Micrarchaeota archaeon]